MGERRCQAGPGLSISSAGFEFNKVIQPDLSYDPLHVRLTRIVSGFTNQKIVLW